MVGILLTRWCLGMKNTHSSSSDALYYQLVENTTTSNNNTRVQVPAETLRTSRVSIGPYDDDIPKPRGRIPSDVEPTTGLCRPKNILFGQLNDKTNPTIRPTPTLIPTPSQEVNVAIKQMKLGKAPGLGLIPIEVW